MDIMNIVECFGIYVGLISIIAGNNKLYKFCEVKKYRNTKKYLLFPHHPQNL